MNNVHVDSMAREGLTYGLYVTFYDCGKWTVIHGGIGGYVVGRYRFKRSAIRHAQKMTVR